MVPLPPLIADEPLGMAGLSYAGGLTVGVVADRDAVPDLPAFVAGAGAALRELGIPVLGIPVSTAA